MVSYSSCETGEYFLIWSFLLFIEFEHANKKIAVDRNNIFVIFIFFIAIKFGFFFQVLTFYHKLIFVWEATSPSEVSMRVLYNNLIASYHSIH